MSTSAPEKLRKFYDHFEHEDHVLIIINADPDAIASAMAVKRLLWRKVSNITISNINIIKRPDNAAMVKLLKVGMVYIEDVKREKYNKFVTVDSQPGHNEAFADFKFDVVIDHHPKTCDKIPFSDIRPHYGATASIMTEYLRAAKIKPSATLATGLFYGIKTDTGGFEAKAQTVDIKALQFLFQYVNLHISRKIQQSELRLDFLKYFKSAIEDMRMRRGRAFIHLGHVPTPDICVLVADFFMRVNPVKWSIVSGHCKDKLIIILRNDGLRKNAGKAAKESFGKFGPAGGHKSAARAEIPCSHIDSLFEMNDCKATVTWLVDVIENSSGKKSNDSEET